MVGFSKTCSRLRKVLASDSPSVWLDGFVASCKVLRAEHCFGSPQVEVGGGAE